MKFSLSLSLSLSLFVSVLFVNTLAAQELLFMPISDEQAALSSEQIEKLASIRENPANASVTMVEVADLFSIQQNARIMIQIPGGAVLTATATALVNTKMEGAPVDWYWQGAFIEGDSMIGIYALRIDGADLPTQKFIVH